MGELGWLGGEGRVEGRRVVEFFRRVLGEGGR